MDASKRRKSIARLSVFGLFKPLDTTVDQLNLNADSSQLKKSDSATAVPTDADVKEYLSFVLSPIFYILITYRLQ